VFTWDNDSIQTIDLKKWVLLQSGDHKTTCNGSGLQYQLATPLWKGPASKEKKALTEEV